MAAGITLSYLGLVVIMACYLLVFSPLPPVASYSGAVLLFATGGMLWGFLYLLKVKGFYRLCVNGVVGTTSIGIAIGVCISGGPVVTPSAMIIVMPAILAFCLLGLKSGLIWAAIIFIAYATGVGMALAGVEFAQISPPELMEVTTIYNWVFAYVSILALVIIYENMNVRLENELNDERNRYKQMATVAIESSVVTESADNLASSGDHLLKSTISQKTALEQLVTTTEELNATAEQNDNLSKEAMSGIEDAAKHVRLSQDDIIQLVEAISKLSSSGDEIQSINNLINEIAYQTNLLSLNAMIEASRAGDGNGGFKVVAIEVKKLAERAANAAEDINNLLKNNKLLLDEGVNVSETMQQRFQEISDKVVPVTSAIQNVSDASFEQLQAIRQINEGLMDIDRAVDENKDLASVTSETANELRNNATSLMNVVKNLQV